MLAFGARSAFVSAKLTPSPPSIIGGSVSLGHGLKPGDQSWHARWFDSFKREFSTAELQDGSLPGVGSGFFSWCYNALIDDNLDLYIVEVSTFRLDRSAGSLLTSAPNLSQVDINNEVS